MSEKFKSIRFCQEMVDERGRAIISRPKGNWRDPYFYQSIEALRHGRPPADSDVRQEAEYAAAVCDVVAREGMRECIMRVVPELYFLNRNRSGTASGAAGHNNLRL